MTPTAAVKLVNLSPVFDPEAHGLDVRLLVEAGEVEVEYVVASDDVRAVAHHDGVLVNHLAVVVLQSHRDSDSVSSRDLTKLFPSCVLRINSVFCKR